MDKKNYNLEVFFESQKKSFVILSKNKISFDEVKQKTMREFRIPKEYEKDMKFTIISKYNRQTTITKDYQIISNFEEMSKNNYYLKIIFNLTNNNYIYHSSKMQFNKPNIKVKVHNVNQFTIISKNKNNNMNNDDIDETKYKEEIKKLKEEIEKLKSEKNYTKGDIDIRKFDEKYRDLNNKNNELEQKITELENENKTLKIGHYKNTSNDNILENTSDGDPHPKDIEKLLRKIIGEHEENMIREIMGIKNTVGIMQRQQKKIYNKLMGIESNEDNDNNNDDDNYEILKEDKIDNIINKKDGKKIQNKINKINIINNLTNSTESENKNSEKNNNNNTNNVDDNFDDIDNLADIILDQKEENKNNNNENSNSKEANSNKSKNIKRNINFFDVEDEKNSKANNDSKYKITKKPEKSIIKEIKNNFLENNNNEIILNKISHEHDNHKIENIYSKYTAPPKNKVVEKMKNIDKRKSGNHSNVNKYGTEENLINYESSSEIDSDTKKMNNKNKVKPSNSQKNFFIKIRDKRRTGTTNNLSKYEFNDKSMTPTGIETNEKERKDKNSFRKNEFNITPGNNKVNTVKENIENYFLNIFQNIFFYGNNSYMNMLKISDKLLKKLRDGVMKYRLNLNDVKDFAIKYISYSIIPIVNDINTKEYQRKIIKNKITTVLECVKIEKNYFEKEYKEFKDEENLEDRSINSINITHAKINEFRKFYELKEKDYPDELIIKALIRYRGNRELAFQYLFY